VLNEHNTVYTFYLISWATSNIYQINSKGLRQYCTTLRNALLLVSVYPLK